MHYKLTFVFPQGSNYRLFVVYVHTVHVASPIKPTDFGNWLCCLHDGSALGLFADSWGCKRRYRHVQPCDLLREVREVLDRCAWRWPCE